MPKPAEARTAGAASAAAPPVATASTPMTASVPIVDAIFEIPPKICDRPSSYLSTSIWAALPLICCLVDTSCSVIWSNTCLAEGFSTCERSEASSLIKAAQIFASSVRLISEPSSPILNVIDFDAKAISLVGSPSSSSGSPAKISPLVLISIFVPEILALPCVSNTMQEVPDWSE